MYRTAPVKLKTNEKMTRTPLGLDLEFKLARKIDGNGHLTDQELWVAVKEGNKLPPPELYEIKDSNMRLCYYINDLAKRIKRWRPDREIGELAQFNDKIKHLKYAPDQFYTTHFLKLENKADYTGMQPQLWTWLENMKRQCKKRGMPFYVHTAYRSPQEQLSLYSAGYSKVKSGAHQRGAAVDLVHPDFHWDAPTEYWLYIELIGKEVARKENIKIGS